MVEVDAAGRQALANKMQKRVCDWLQGVVSSLALIDEAKRAADAAAM